MKVLAQRVFSEISPLSHEFHTDDYAPGKGSGVIDGPNLHGMYLNSRPCETHESLIIVRVKLMRKWRYFTKYTFCARTSTWI